MKKQKTKELGSILVSTVILVFLLSLLGITLQQFLRGQIKDQYGMQGDVNGAYNLSVNNANTQAKYMAQFGLNRIIWAANQKGSPPGTVGDPDLEIFAGGRPGPSASPLANPTPNPTVTPGYADPQIHRLPEPVMSPYPAATPSAITYEKDYLIESPAPGELKVTGRSYFRGNTTSAAGAIKRVEKTIYAQWVQTGGLVPPAGNLIGWWTGDGTANDSSGNANHGTAFGGTSYAAGKLANAFNFDGTTGYVALPVSYNAVGALPTFTVAAWVNTTFTAGGYNSNWAIMDFDRSEYFDCYIHGDGRVGFSTEPSVGGIHDMNGVGIVNDGVWHHVACVYDGTDKIIYVDGAEDNRVVNPHAGNPIGNGSTRFGIIADGSEATAFNGARNNIYYDGMLDDIFLYERVLTPAEINVLVAATPSSFHIRKSTWREDQ